MESLIEAIPFRPEWGELVLWVGMFGITLLLTKPADWIAQGITSLVMPIAKLGGQGDGEHLRLGGSKAGFDIEKSSLKGAVRTILMIAFFLLILQKTGICFPNRIRFW